MYQNIQKEVLVSHRGSAINLLMTQGEVEVMSLFQAHQSYRIEKNQRRQMVQLDSICNLLEKCVTCILMLLQHFDRGAHGYVD